MLRQVPLQIRAAYLLLLAGAIALVAVEGIAAAGEPSYRGRAYRVVAPQETPRGALVFLHGKSTKPFLEEGEAIDTLTKRAVERGFVAIVPKARRLCGGARCWSLAAVEEELVYVDALIDHVEQETGHALRNRQIVGFSQGGFLLAGAAERGLLNDYTRVGILGGGAVGEPPAEKATLRAPLFLEVGSEDKYQWASMHELFHRLSSTASPAELYFREVDGGHAISARRVDSFLRWFWRDAKPQRSAGADPSAASRASRASRDVRVEHP